MKLEFEEPDFLLLQDGDKLYILRGNTLADDAIDATFVLKDVFEVVKSAWYCGRYWQIENDGRVIGFVGVI